MQLHDLAKGTKALVVWNGFDGHLKSGAGFRDMLSLLYEKKADIDVLLIVPGEWAEKEVARAMGPRVPWMSKVNSDSKHYPTQLLLKAGETYRGFVYDHHTVAYEIEPGFARQMYDAMVS